MAALCSSALVTIGNPTGRLKIVGGEVGGVAWSSLVIPPTPVKAVRKHLSSYAIQADYQAHVYRNRLGFRYGDMETMAMGPEDGDVDGTLAGSDLKYIRSNRVFRFHTTF
jgi:hypothetical protein